MNTSSCGTLIQYKKIYSLLMAKLIECYLATGKKTFPTLRNKTFLYSCKTSNQMKGYITYAYPFDVLLTMAKYVQLSGLNSENKTMR